MIRPEMEQRMDIAQRISSMVLSLRKKERLRVRQPLQRIMVPILDPAFEGMLKRVEELILSEVNVKELTYLHDTNVLVKSIKANFKTLGPRFGKDMKAVAAIVAAFGQDEIAEIEKAGEIAIQLPDGQQMLQLADVEIQSQDIPGWLVVSDGGITVALDITLTPELVQEGIAREMVNRIQNLRKDTGLEVTDKISLRIGRNAEIEAAVQNNLDYICRETLAGKLEIVDHLEGGHAVQVDEELSTVISIERMN
jgi:isoleucyl-tRNA synthetase